MAGRRCPATRCPRVITDGSRYCPEHLAQYEAARGTTTARGYGATHQALRRAWQARMDAGEIVHCSLCGEVVTGRKWHLDHAPDATAYRGPAHEFCNTSDGGTRGAQAANERTSER